jgi:hypothetical protein
MARIGRIGTGIAAAAMVSMTAAAPGLTQNRQPGEMRCGWYHNPTPGNHMLYDRHGRWILGSQGLRQTPGMDRLPDMTTNGWVRTNGYYGYGCGCVRMATRRGEVVRIYSGRPVPLRQCRNDRTLPSPE